MRRDRGGCVLGQVLGWGRPGELLPGLGAVPRAAPRPPRLWPGWGLGPAGARRAQAGGGGGKGLGAGSGPRPRPQDPGLGPGAGGAWEPGGGGGGKGLGRAPFPRSPGAGTGSRLRAAPRQSLRAGRSSCLRLCGGGTHPPCPGGTEPSTPLPAEGPLPPGGGRRTGRERPRLGRPRAHGAATPENRGLGSQPLWVRSCRGGPARPPPPPPPLCGSHRNLPRQSRPPRPWGRSGASFLPAAPGFPPACPPSGPQGG